MTQFLNGIEDIGWLITTHLKNKNPPHFNSFLIQGNEDCPSKIILFSKMNPTCNSQPVATYKADKDGNIFLTSTVSIHTN